MTNCNFHKNHHKAWLDANESVKINGIENAKTFIACDGKNHWKINAKHPRTGKPCANIVIGWCPTHTDFDSEDEKQKEFFGVGK